MDSTKHHIARYHIGDRVKKASGYSYPGVVVSIFETLSGKLRYVVEHEISIGMLHIFNEEQLIAQEPES